MTNQTTQETKPKKTKAEYVEMLMREFVQIESIMENVSEIKSEIKDAGMDATLLAKVAKALSENKASDIIEKNEMFAEMVEELRGA